MDKLTPCPFCGQMTYIPEDCQTEQEQQRAALERCECDQAQNWRREETRIDEARAALLEVLMCDLVQEDEQPTERLTDLLCAFLPLMVREDVTQISVTAERLGKLTVTYNGQFKVKKHKGLSIERKA